MHLLLSGVLPAQRLDLAAQPLALRQTLAALLQQNPTWQAAWMAGQQSAATGTAFFCGYQCAMRQLDADLPADEWAAFCISEAGMRSLKDMQTLYQDGTLQGIKSHVMLADSGLDSLYVVARQADTLVCVKVAATAPGLTVVAATKPQPFLPDVVHSPVTFTQTPVDNLYCQNAHERLNRPFRYWEDVHILLALAGWMTVGVAEECAQSVVIAATELADCFRQQPGAYSLTALDAVDALVTAMDQLAPELAPSSASAWQRDRRLLITTQPLRDRIRTGLSVQA